jgi:hypothetical protein
VNDDTYHNPILPADFSDPDVIRVGDDFYLVASSFSRVPGLPVLHSRDLVHWRLAGHALDRLEPVDVFATPQPGCGVWAPAIRHHQGLFRIFYPDPDRGIFVVTAGDPVGPWSRPHALKTGRGLIDPCPLWDDDGNAYLVHAWAKSRAGFNNRLTLHRMTPDATALLDDGRTVIDGNYLAGYRTLEGPKLYQRDGWYWIFAPAGGVTDGWQAAFRSRDIFGPYAERIVLARGNTPVNGPHQGAWVDTPNGEHWFLHFQDRGPFGRVVHLQPMHWGEDGWPVIGDHGAPVLAHRRPALPLSVPPPPAMFGPEWTWAANPQPGWHTRTAGGLRLACVPHPDHEDLRRLPNILGLRLPAQRCTASVAVQLDSGLVGARAGLAIVGSTFAWAGVIRTPGGPRLVLRTSESEATLEAGDIERVVLQVRIDESGKCQFLAGVPGGRKRPIGRPFAAAPGQWVGAALSVFATAPASAEPAAVAGHALFTDFTIRPER